MALLVNHELIDDEAFLEEFRRLGGLHIHPEASGARQEALLLSRLAEEKVIGRVLLRQMAVASGITITKAEIDEQRKHQWGTSSASVCSTGVKQEIEENLLIEKYCHWITRHELRPSRTELHTHYMNHREQFLVPEQAQVMQVIRNIRFEEDEAIAKAEIEQAEKELQQGIPFAKVAERYSDCGGKIMLGWIRRGEMIPEFEEIVFSTSPGQRSGIFRTLFGYHIVSVMHRKPAGYQAFEEVRPMLAQHILQERKNRRVGQIVSEAMRRAEIVPVPSTSEERASLP
ncbi:peptidylprolyl isomerase [Edaphobacter albus]|uniref:peptidylprolyl isomerase n=1 Tax=Edaphobacter sp. 4G125 TaxID=2763071 RepID=UPI00164666ED|nr:peptidylprolyl isomerase [Edaphobacter sp. 4G125]QNI36439.1 peptidylprolyl isomerase [Edaphobacter sp. 4G125]